VAVTPESGNYYAVTSASGGYAFPFNGTGSLNVVFSGGQLAQSVERTVERGDVNLKLDLELNSATPLAIASGVLVVTPSMYQFTFSGPPDRQAEVQRSTNFVHWDVLATYLLGAESVVFQDNNPPAGQATYRVVVP
jgi:hypothetical protein